MKLVEFSINRPVTTYMMIATILLLGMIAFFRLPVDLMPEMEFPTLTVATTFPRSLRPAKQQFSDRLSYPCSPTSHAAERSTVLG